MPDVMLYCHACQHSTFQERSSQPEEPTCPSCASTFVELHDRPRRRERRPELFRAVTDAETQPVLVGGGLDGAGILQQMLTALASQGGQITMGPDGATFGANIGDFAFGGLEGLMNQLMEDHQPQIQPTAQSFRDNLPQRKVPASADVKGSDVYAPGHTCKAGDPCTICHNEFVAEEAIVQLPCEHCFHDQCIHPWLATNHTCPICRLALPTQAAPNGARRRGADFRGTGNGGTLNPALGGAVNVEGAMGDFANAMINWNTSPMEQGGEHLAFDGDATEEDEDGTDFYTDSNAGYSAEATSGDEEMESRDSGSSSRRVQRHRAGSTEAMIEDGPSSFGMAEIASVPHHESSASDPRPLQHASAVQSNGGLLPTTEQGHGDAVENQKSTSLEERGANLP